MGEVEKPDQNQQASKRQEPEALPGLRLMRIGRALALVSGAAVALLTVLIVGGLALLGVQGLKPEAQVSATTLFDLLKIAFAAVAGLGGLVALVVAYRRQKVGEAAQQLAEAAHDLDRQGEDRAHRAEQRETTKLHNERFATAAGQLGHDSPAVRLAGVHALAGLADDAPTRELRQTCIDVLCAYLRMPYAPDPGKDASEPDQLAFAGLREVRLTIVRLIAAHLLEGASISWQGHDLDFTGVVFDAANFSRSIFSGGHVSFDKATFAGETTHFMRAVFSGATISFSGATFISQRVMFSGADFVSGRVFFDYGTFAAKKFFFTDAIFSGAQVSFGGATFASGEVSFRNAKFLGGTITFLRTVFDGAVVNFFKASFAGTVMSFTRVMFNGGQLNFENVSSWDVPPWGVSMPTPAIVILPKESQDAQGPPILGAVESARDRDE